MRGRAGPRPDSAHALQSTGCVCLQNLGSTTAPTSPLTSGSASNHRHLLTELSSMNNEMC